MIRPFHPFTLVQQNRPLPQPPSDDVDIFSAEKEVQLLVCTMMGLHSWQASKTPVAHNSNWKSRTLWLCVRLSTTVD